MKPKADRKQQWDQKLLLLRPGQRQQIEEAAGYVHENLMDFIRHAVMERVGEIEERMARARETKEKTGVFAPKQPDLPSWARTEKREDDDHSSIIVPSAPTVTVVVPTSNAGGGDMIERLAAYVLSATSSIDRADRERYAVKFLEIVPEAERASLAQALDARIAAKSGTEPSVAKRALSWLTGGRSL